MEEKIIDNRIISGILYTLALSFIIFFFQNNQMLFFLSEDGNILLNGSGEGINFKNISYVCCCICLFIAGIICCIQSCRISNDFFGKKIGHIVGSIVSLSAFLFAKQYISYIVLLLVGCAFFLMFLFDKKENKYKLIIKGLVAISSIAILTLVTSFSPKEWRGELYFHITGEENIVETFFNYKDDDNYKRAGTAEDDKKIIFNIDDKLLNSKELVFTVALEDSLQEAEQVEIIGLDIYSEEFLLGRISGATMACSIKSKENLEDIDATSDSMVLEWSQGEYAQIYFDEEIPTWISNILNVDFISLIQAIYFLLVVFNARKSLEYLFRIYNEREKNKIECLVICNFQMLLVSIGEIFAVELTSGSMIYISSVAFIINVCLVYFVNLILFSILNMQIAVTITGIFLGIIGIANYYTLMYRGTPIMPWDIYSVNTAANVMGNYNIYITWEMIWALFIMGIPILGCFIIRKTKNNDIARINWKGRCITLIIGILCIIFCMNAGLLKKVGIQENVYNQKNNYIENGWFLASVLNLKYMKVEKPDDFSAEKVQEILDDYQTTKDDTEDMPNIVIILNESFSDLQSIYSLDTNTEVMPFIAGLEGNNVAKGTCYVSQIGGATCNSEYELLTASTMAFFPSGSIVFQQHMNDEQYSVINMLNEYGYKTIGMHPMPGSNWQRTEAYPLLQFKDMEFYEDMENIEYVRKYASDQYCYKWIIEQFENKFENDKLAIYNLTVQNHGGFEEEGYAGEIVVENYDNKAWNQYLSLVHESDAALEGLFNYFLGIDDKVIVLFMGDHQPSLPSLEGSAQISEMDHYSVPYLLWNNYGETMEVPEKISINYLATYLLKNGQIPRSSYYLFLEEMCKDIPVINSVGYIEDGTLCKWEEGASNQWIDKYKVLQYGMNSADIIQKDEFYE